MYVPSVECTSVVHVVMLSLKSAGEGAGLKVCAPQGRAKSSACASRWSGERADFRFSCQDHAAYGLACVCTCQQMNARACVILELMDK